MAVEYHSLKKQHYLTLIKECAHSGKTNREWCSENGIAYSSFMRWQALLRDEAAGKVMEQQAIWKVRADLERKGTPIGPMDVLIAGHAKSEGLILVTSNTREFFCVNDLEVDDWQSNLIRR